MWAHYTAVIGLGITNENHTPNCASHVNGKYRTNERLPACLPLLASLLIYLQNGTQKTGNEFRSWRIDLRRGKGRRSY